MRIFRRIFEIKNSTRAGQARFFENDEPSTISNSKTQKATHLIGNGILAERVLANVQRLLVELDIVNLQYGRASRLKAFRLVLELNLLVGRREIAALELARLHRVEQRALLLLWTNATHLQI